MKTAMQNGISHSCDFEENTWTFEMQEGFEVMAGEFVIMTKEAFKQQIINSNINGTQEPFIIAFKSVSGRYLIFTDQDLEDQKQEAENYYT